MPQIFSGRMNVIVRSGIIAVVLLLASLLWAGLRGPAG